MASDAARIAGTRCASHDFVIGAHYDTVAGSPGADDDASGVAGVLAFARALALQPLPATVVLAAFPFEEDPGDFAGSNALAGELTRTEKVIGMVSLEMIGYTSSQTAPFFGGRGDFLAYVGNPAAKPLIATFVSALARSLAVRSNSSRISPPKLCATNAMSP